MTTNLNKKGKDCLFLGLNKAKGVNVLDAITEFSTATNSYLKPSEIDTIVSNLSNDDYIEVLKKYLNKQAKVNKRKEN